MSVFCTASFPPGCVKNARNTEVLLRFFPCPTKNPLENPAHAEFEEIP